MHPTRPKVRTRPCPVCGEEVDPLRAPRVSLRADGFRYFCSPSCETRFLGGENSFDAPSRLTGHPDAPRTRQDPTTGRFQIGGSLSPLVHEPVTVQSAPRPPAYVSVGLALAGAAAALISAADSLGDNSAIAGYVGFILVVSSVLLFAYQHPDLKQQVGISAWATSIAGAILAATAGLLSGVDSTPNWLPLAGAAGVAVLVFGRSFLFAKTREPIELESAELLSALPPEARIPLDDPEDNAQVRFETRPSGDLAAGDVILVLKGETAAADGFVVAGKASVLAHPGARSRGPRSVGDSILAGARVVDGALRIQVTQGGEQSALAKVGTFAKTGEATGLPFKRWRRKEGALLGRGMGSPTLGFARGAADAALLAATGAVPLAVLLNLHAGWAGSMAAAAGVLLALPLFSLRSSASFALWAGALSGFRRGVVFSDVETLDVMGSAKIAALSTRGTVTEGILSVTEIRSVDGGDVERVLALAAGAEASEGHPMALAIRKYAEAQHVTPERVRRSKAVPGRGIRAVAATGESLVIGSRQLLLDEGISIAAGDPIAAQAEEKGLSVVFVGVDNKVRAILLLADPPRKGARGAVQRLFDLAIEVILISGDHRSTVEAVAKTLDVTNTRAELTPDERGAEIRRLRQAGGAVAVVGRAGYDDRALGDADVSVMLLEAGRVLPRRGVGLASDDVHEAAVGFFVADVARRFAQRAVTIAIAGGAALVLLAIAGLAGPFLIALFAGLIDLLSFPAGSQVLRRIDLRVPARDL